MQEIVTKEDLSIALDGQWSCITWIFEDNNQLSDVHVNLSSLDGLLLQILLVANVCFSQ